eukprot:500518-Rhodomonas_salina.1
MPLRVPCVQRASTAVASCALLLTCAGTLLPGRVGNGVPIAYGARAHLHRRRFQERKPPFRGGAQIQRRNPRQAAAYPPTAR